MTSRTFQINAEAEKYEDTKEGNAYLGFKAGAEWADANPVTETLEEAFARKMFEEGDTDL